MLWTIAVLLLVLWALGFFVASVGNIIHILLVLAIIAIIWNLVAGRGTRAV